MHPSHRPVLSGDYDSANDIVFYYRTETEQDFRQKFAGLRAEIAGVPDKLRRFREGDTSLIATEKLVAPDDASRRVQNRVQVARRAFYSTLRDTTQRSCDPRSCWRRSPWDRQSPNRHW